MSTPTTRPPRLLWYCTCTTRPLRRGGGGVDGGGSAYRRSCGDGTQRRWCCCRCSPAPACCHTVGRPSPSCIVHPASVASTDAASSTVCRVHRSPCEATPHRGGGPPRRVLPAVLPAAPPGRRGWEWGRPAPCTPRRSVKSPGRAVGHRRNVGAAAVVTAPAGRACHCRQSTTTQPLAATVEKWGGGGGRGCAAAPSGPVAPLPRARAPLPRLPALPWQHRPCRQGTRLL